MGNTMAYEKTQNAKSVFYSTLKEDSLPCLMWLHC